MAFTYLDEQPAEKKKRGMFTYMDEEPERERMSRGEAMWFAGKMGLKDTYRGAKQIAGIGEEQMAEDQRILNELMEDEEYGGAVTAAYFGGMVADPVGLALPISRLKHVGTGLKALGRLAKLGAISGGTFGTLGYVDPEAPSLLTEGQMTRPEQALIGAGGGAILGPVIGGASKALGKAYEPVGDFAWKALSTKPEVGGASVGALAGYNMDMDASPQDKMRNAIKGVLIGGGGGLAVRGINKMTDDSLSRWFVPDWGLDADYVTRRGQFQGDRSIIREEFQGLVQRIAREPEVVRKALYKMLTNPHAPVDESVVGLQKETRELVTKYGAELKDLGVLDPKVFEKNLDTYLHRTYLRPKNQKFFSTDQKIRTIGDELRMRGIKKEVSAKQWDAGRRPDGEGEWEVLDKKGKNYIVRRDYSEAERMEMGEVTDAAMALNRTGLLMANDVSAYRFFRDIAANPRLSIGPEDGPVGKFTERVPDDTVTGLRGGPKKFGELADRYVTKELYDDLIRVGQLRSKDSRVDKLFAKYKKLNALWKVSKTALNPAVHMNNIVSNVHLYDFYDGNFKYLAKAMGDMRTKNDMYKEALGNGVFGADFIGHEIGPEFEAITRAYSDIGAGAEDALGWSLRNAPRIAQRLAKFTKKWTFDKMLRAYMVEDHVFRMGIYRTAKEKLMKDGLGESEAMAMAARKAREGFVDYSRTTPALEIMRNGPLPFISYMYGVVPRLAETAAKKPMKLAKWGLIWQGLNAAGEDMSDTPKEDIDYQRKLMQNYQRRTLMGVPGMPAATIKMPDFMSPKTNEDWYLDIGRMVPGGDIFGMTEGGVGQVPFLPQSLQPSFGAGGAIYNTLMGVDPFKGKEIPGGPEGRAKHLGQQFIPNLPIPGAPTYAGEKIKRAMTGKPQPTKDYHTPLSATLSGLGIKTTPVTSGKGVLRQRMKLQTKIRALDEERGSLRRQYISGDIDQVELSNRLKEIQREKAKLKREFGEKVRR